MLKRLIVLGALCASVFTASFASAKAQDIIKMNSDIFITENVSANDVVSIGGNVTVSGRVENNIVAIGGSVTLKGGSYVGGEIVIVGGEIIKDQGAVIGGKITQVYMPRFIPSLTDFLNGKWVALWATISVLALLGFLGLAILFVGILPEHIAHAVKILERSFFAMLLWGLLWAILIVPITVLLAISIIGIILIPLEIIIVALALIIGYITSAIFIGKNILSSLKKMPFPFADVILGIIILFLVGFVPVIGPIVKIFFLLAGFGAIIVTRFGTIKIR